MPNPSNQILTSPLPNRRLKNVNRINGDLKIGKLREMTISTADTVFILRFVGQDYFLAMALSSEGNFGRGRLRIAPCGTSPRKRTGYMN